MINILNARTDSQLHLCHHCVEDGKNALLANHLATVFCHEVIFLKCVYRRRKYGAVTAFSSSETKCALMLDCMPSRPGEPK